MEVPGPEGIVEIAPVMVDESALARQRSGYYLYGIARSRGWRRRCLPLSEGARLRRVRFRELEAIVGTTDYELPDLDTDHLAEHQWVMSRMACDFTILPAPPGVIFEGRRALVRFLDDQYLALVEGLALLEGHWEFRLHIGRSGREPARGSARETTKLFAELRRLAHAALSFPRQEGKLLSAAFLVEKYRWIEFVEEAEELGLARPELVIDLTGPWPPYDFVRLVF